MNAENDPGAKCVQWLLENRDDYDRAAAEDGVRDVLDALTAAGYHVVQEGQEVVVRHFREGQRKGRL